MKPIILFLLLQTIVVNCFLHAQSVVHPWHVFDRGGGTSVGVGTNLQSSVGQPAVTAMTAVGINNESGYIPGIRQLMGTTASLNYLTENSWNMLSVPVIENDFRKTSIYPGAVSVAYTYTGSYRQRDTLSVGAGYWLKFTSPQNFIYSGTAVTVETLTVTDKWNMIGCTSYPVRTADIVPIPPTTIASNFFGYSSSSGYFTEDTLQPGKGYWIKVNNAGKLVLRSGSVMNQPTIMAASNTSEHFSDNIPTALQQLKDISSLTVTDANQHARTIYFTNATQQVDKKMFELPPLPPEGILEMRYAGNRLLETAGDEPKSTDILISSAGYPLVLSWKLPLVNTPIAKLSIDGKEILMSNNASVRITDPASRISLELSSAKEQQLPLSFALWQNYPNPFNPATTIRYDLPGNSHVTIRIYNLLGEQITTLVDEFEDAGFKSVQWNSTNNRGVVVGNGVYYYRIEVRGIGQSKEIFSQVRKMIMVK